ncbi:uncharacterized protein LY79DRAFT_568640 [Colletotrichum navitas]|uniref:Uncharacterized protein n=1 Tax=Colletotrichum navitas TaxID=681940 RepID=A0AAD8PP57_9PEZI|nr:uncharacterized protein LY79DRAFT_568640 [Colletotrichum navitas]KAK1573351.1 hypothetical protein LY79DRAFT_568640 [Colletotrichum navitas]
MTNPDVAGVGNLAERFEDIALFREFPNVDDDEIVTAARSSLTRLVMGVRAAANDI